MSTRSRAVDVILAGAFAAAAACGGSSPGAGGAGSPGGAAAAKTSTTAARGADPCVDLVQMVHRCIDTKMPDEERAAARSDIKHYEGTWAAFLTPARCQERIVSEVRGDEYQ